MLWLLRGLYSLFVLSLIPFAFLRLLIRSRYNTEYRKRWRERLGFVSCDKKCQQGIWIHAVSVGEVNVALPLIKALKQQQPNLPIVVTTMTITGSDRVKSQLGDSVFHYYLPYDLPCAMMRFIKRIQPKAVVIMETEVWPNLLFGVKKKHIPLFLANGRLSEKSAKGYRRFSWLTRPLFQCFDQVAAQSKEDAARFQSVGVLASKITVTGNIKFDITIDKSVFEKAKQLRKLLGQDRFIWIAASTRDDEEKIILQAFAKVKSVCQDALLLLVPRHPERFNRVAHLCEEAGFSIIRKSENRACNESTDVFLGDTMGELLIYYGASDIAFVGGSLLPLGGQNMLEAAAFSLPIIMGPHLFNFAQASELLLAAKALMIVHCHEELADVVIKFSGQSEERQAQGKRGKAVVEQNRGALHEHLQILESMGSRDF